MTLILESVGAVFAYIALAFGLLFFIFACKYYVAILLVLLGGKSARKGENNTNWSHNYRFTSRVLNYFNGNKDPASGGLPNGGQSDQAEEPFISIHLPFYNERNVARRILDACINLDYSNYEVLVVDDSRDETVNILREMKGRKGGPTLKFIHRRDRQGFKGGALGEAMKHMDPRTEYVVVFDADFIPQPDILRRFLWYFNRQNGNNKNHNNGLASGILNHFNNHKSGKGSTDPEGKVEKGYEAQRVAAVQGYQLHSLNKSENWLTKGVRAEFSGSYMVERVTEEFFGAMKMISGSVFMLRADVLKNLGWTTSITEDWDLTLRLYLSGYKVVYTPLIYAPAEIPTTIMRLVRQRMRWAEGHTFAVKKYFWKVLRSPMLTLREKLEFLYFSPYYLQSLFFIIGSFCWLIVELLGQHLPFWNATFGWSLVLSNLLSLPLMGLTGLFLENSALKDLRGILSFIALSYIVAPFQAYAALKGLLEKEEGTWIRTLKTGTITDKILRIQMRKVFDWVSPKKRSISEKKERRGHGVESSSIALISLLLMSTLIATMGLAAVYAPVLPAEARAEKLSLWYSEKPVNINGINTSRLLTTREISSDEKTRMDAWETFDEGWEKVWSFYLDPPLAQDYILTGQIHYVLYLYASQAGEVSLKFVLYDMGPDGVSHMITTDQFYDLRVNVTSPLSLTGEEVKERVLLPDHRIVAEIHIKGHKGVTYFLEYGSTLKPSHIELSQLIPIPRTHLSLEYSNETITVCNIKTNRYMTHPNFTSLEEVAHEDSYVTNDPIWHEAWGFYLYGPLERAYTLNGRIVYVLYLYANKTFEAKICVSIYDVDESGNSKCIDFDNFLNIELKDHSSEWPVILVSKVFKSYTFQAGHTMKVVIWVKGFDRDSITFYLEYDSPTRNSRIEFPGIVLPEGLLFFLPLAPFIPALIWKGSNRRRRERDEGSG